MGCLHSRSIGSRISATCIADLFEGVTHESDNGNTIRIAVIGMGCSSSLVASILWTAAFRYDPYMKCVMRSSLAEDPHGLGTLCASLLTGVPPDVDDDRAMWHSQRFHGGVLVQWGIHERVQLCIAQVDGHPLSYADAISWALESTVHIICIHTAVPVVSEVKQQLASAAERGVVVLTGAVTGRGEDSSICTLPDVISVGGLNQAGQPLAAYLTTPTLYAPGEKVLGLAHDGAIELFKQLGHPDCKYALQKATAAVPAVMFAAAACAVYILHGVQPKNELVRLAANLRSHIRYCRDYLEASEDRLTSAETGSTKSNRLNLLHAGRVPIASVS